MKPTLYRVLGVAEDASTDQLKLAWRKIAKSCHPDRTTDPRRHRRFELAVQAKEVLLDDELRSVYDQELLQKRLMSGGFQTEAEPRAQRPRRTARCEVCGTELGENGCLRCSLMDLSTRKHVSESRRREPPPKRKVKIDLDPILDEMRARELSGHRPGWEESHSSADSLLSKLLHQSASRPLRLGGRGGGPRVEIHVSPEMVVVLDQDTFDTLHRVRDNIGFAKRMMDTLSRWVTL